MQFKKNTVASVAVIAVAISASSAAFAANDMSSSDSTKASTSSSSQEHLQGLYSADHLMDAKVYSKGNSKHAIGEIDDILLGNSMSVQKFVVETDGKFGLGGKSYVVTPGELTVETMKSSHASKPNYKVMLDMSKKELASQPVYSDSWLTNAQQQASQAWQNTKQSAHSAWTDVKSTASNVMSGAKDQASDAKQATSNAADNAADKTQNAADTAADKTQNAADKAADKANDMTNGNNN